MSGLGNGGPWLIAVGGGVASGKSTLARGIASAIGAQRLEADQTRVELMRASATHGDSAALRAFSTAAADEVYEEMIARADPLLRAGQDVVLDGCFATRRQRDRARDVAAAAGARFHLLACLADRQIVEARLAERAQLASLAPDSWVRLFEALEARRESPGEVPAGERSEVRTDVAPARSVADALRALEGRGLRPGERVTAA